MVEEEECDSAVLLMVKDDVITVKGTGNMTSEEMLEVLAAATIALKNTLDKFSGANTHTMQ